MFMTPRELGALIASELEKWAKVIKFASLAGRPKKRKYSRRLGIFRGSWLGAIVALSAASERRTEVGAASRRLLGSYGELPCIASSLD